MYSDSYLSSEETWNVVIKVMMVLDLRTVLATKSSSRDRKFILYSARAHPGK